jgi:succinate dehydrogenase/fumarate reductase flavoprotein subunit
VSATLTCDLAVVGSGAAGLATAVTAAFLGLDVIVVEKEAQIGGTSAWSGGWLWAPRNPLAVAAGIEEDIERPLSYLRAELGDGFDEPLARRFLEEAPRMVAFMRRHTALDFVDGNAIPDFHDASPGAASGGRSVCAAPFDGRLLGPRIRDLKPPLDLVSPFGMGIASGADLRHFLDATRRWAAFRHAAGRMLRHWRDSLLHGRGMHLVNGNALVARLLKSADDLGVRFVLSSPAKSLLRAADGSVTGLTCGPAGETHIAARRGVVLAAGGFPHDEERKAALFPHAPTGREHFSAAPPGNTGDGLRLGETAGGCVRQDLAHAGAWAPVSLVPGRDGAIGHFPHLIERAKPGLVMVTRDGRRFANEADSYHDLMQALFAATPQGAAAECWMVADHAFIRRYGMGRVRPRPFPLRPWIANGYLSTGRTMAALAAAAGIDAGGLADTMETFNVSAARGLDPAFGRGGSAYNRVQGEAGWRPNPCVRPLGPGPYYAIRIAPGSLGTFAGLDTDADARVLGADGGAIAGLYAVGNDMASIMRGRYPAGGITLGPGMTFGYIAAHHAAGVPLHNNRWGADHAA